MSLKHVPEWNDLSVDLLESIDLICDRFEAEWNVSAPPEIEPYVSQIAAPHQAVLRLELQLIDHELRERSGLGTQQDQQRTGANPSQTVFLPMSTDLGLYRSEQTRGATVANGDPDVAEWIRRKQGTNGDSEHCPPRTDSDPWQVDGGDRANGLESTHAGALEPQEPGAAEFACDTPTSPLRYPVVSLSPGCVIGDYQILGLLGHGGMGSVFRARQRRLGRDVALKVIRTGVHATPREIQLFKREAEAAAALDHSSIVPILDIGEYAGLIFFSMKLIEGRNLHAALEQINGNQNKIADIMARIARALHHAHERGVLHRDLKPSNILIDGDGLPHLIDFGLARRASGEGDSLYQGASIVGTLSYMSPEQARGERDQVTIASDVYGLGAVLYALICGCAPFQAASPVELMKQVIENDPLRPRLRNTRVHPDLELICLKCLEKDPHKRYASALELALDLERLIDGVPILARPVSASERVVRFVRRRRGLAASLALIALIAAAGACGVVWQWRAAISLGKKLQAALVVARDQKAAARASELSALGLAYAANIRLAERDWRDANIQGVERALKAAAPAPGNPDLRGFEWHYLNRLLRTSNFKIDDDDAGLGGLTYSRDGRRIAAVGRDKTIKIWDAATGQGIRKIAAGGIVNDLDFDPHGERLLGAGPGPGLTIWDLGTGQIFQTLKGHGANIQSARYSPDGRRILSSGFDGTIRLWDAASQTLLWRQENHPKGYGVNAIFSIDGRLVLTAGGIPTALRIRNAETGALIKTIADATTNSHVIALAPDGATVATAGEDGSIKIRDLASGAPRGLLFDPHHPDSIRALAYAPDGRTIACVRVSDRGVELWDVAAARVSRVFRGHPGVVTGVVFAPDRSDRMASCSSDSSIRVWHRDQDQESTLLEHPATPWDVAFAPDGSFAAAACLDGMIQLSDPSSGRRIRTFAANQRQRVVTISPDGRLVAAAGDDAAVRLWEASSGTLLHTLKGHSAAVFALAFDATGARLASGSDDRTIRLWNVADGTLDRTLAGHPGKVNHLIFEPGGKSLLSGGDDGFAITWDLDSGLRKQTQALEPDGIVGMDESADGKLIATSGFSSVITIWDRATGLPLQRLAGHATTPHRLHFSHDGSRLASASIDRTIRIWNPALGLELLVLRGHSRSVWCAQFSPDGRTLASCGGDHTVRYWRAEEPSVKH